MSRFIILIEREPTVVFPIVQGEPDDQTIAIFPTLEAARETADQNLMCRAFAHQIIDLDETEDLS